MDDRHPLRPLPPASPVTLSPVPSRNNRRTPANRGELQHRRRRRVAAAIASEIIPGVIATSPAIRPVSVTATFSLAAPQ
jgi:hypothetical protein